MRNWAFLLNGRAQKVRAVLVASATVVLFAAMLVSFQQMPRGADAQVYSPAAPGETDESADALEAFQTERAGSRIAQLAALDKLIDAGGAQAEEAARQKLELISHMETETTLEGILRAQGFSGCVCTVHADSCNVLVRAGALTDAQTARILSAAGDETGLSPANIKIIPVE